MTSTLTTPEISEPYFPPPEPERIFFVCGICGRQDSIANDEDYRRGLEALDKLGVSIPLPNLCSICEKALNTPRSRPNGILAQPLPPPTIDDLLRRHRPTRFKKRPPLEVPAEFIDTDPNHPDIDSRAFARVQGYRLSKRGLLLRGRSGLGKSRAAWALLARLWSEGVAVRGHDTGELSRLYEQKQESGWGHWFVSELAKIPVLLIDDLGNETRMEEMIYSTIKARCEKGRPTIITTQHTSESLYKNTTNPQRLSALIRRLREHFDDVTFTVSRATK